MSKVIITVGIPASGKSTWARDAAKADANMVITCRDDIRAAHGFGFGDFAIEKRITEIQRGQIEAGLNDGKTIIVADTNINQKFRKQLIKFAHQHGADVEVIVFPISLDEAIVRDSKRAASVGPDVIFRFHQSLSGQEVSNEFIPCQRYTKVERQPGKREDAIVVDIDGTIARHWNRSPYEYNKVGDDEPIEDVIAIIEAVSNTFKVIFVSGREDSCREETVKWLSKYVELDYDYALHMRKAGDVRPDWIIKNEIYDAEVLPTHNVVMVFDDRDQVVKHLRKRGITVAQVAPGRF